MQRLRAGEAAPQADAGGDQTLEETVEDLIGGGAAQPLMHGPDMEIDDAPSERVVEGPALGRGLGAWGLVGRRRVVRHAETSRRLTPSRTPSRARPEIKTAAPLPFCRRPPPLPGEGPLACSASARADGRERPHPALSRRERVPGGATLPKGEDLGAATLPDAVRTLPASVARGPAAQAGLSRRDVLFASQGLIAV